MNCWFSHGLSHAMVWSPHKLGPGKCILCDPPDRQNVRRVGVIKPDGEIMMVSDITVEIAEMNRLTNSRAVAAKHPELSPSSAKPTTLPSTNGSESPLVGCWYRSTPSKAPPPEVIAVPGEGFWRDQSVIDAAKEEFNRWTEENKTEKIAGEPEKKPEGEHTRIRNISSREAAIDLSD